jgi:hypothetical protein
MDAQIPARSCRNTASVDEGGRNETACRRIGVSAWGRNETACRHAWRGRVALPRDPRCTFIELEQAKRSKRRIKGCGGVISKGKFPDVQRRSRGSATLPRHACRFADPPTRRYAVSLLRNGPAQIHSERVRQLECLCGSPILLPHQSGVAR